MTKKNRQGQNEPEQIQSQKTRITLDLSPGGYARLQKLAKAANATSANVLRQALQLYEFVVEKTNEGARFKSVDSAGNETEVRFLGYPD